MENLCKFAPEADSTSKTTPISRVEQWSKILYNTRCVASSQHPGSVAAIRSLFSDKTPLCSSYSTFRIRVIVSPLVLLTNATRSYEHLDDPDTHTVPCACFVLCCYCRPNMTAIVRTVRVSLTPLSRRCMHSISASTNRLKGVAPPPFLMRSYTLSWRMQHAAR